MKLANLRYTSVRNDYSLIFDVNSEIRKVEDDESIQTHSFNFRNIDELLLVQGQR